VLNWHQICPKTASNSSVVDRILLIQKSEALSSCVLRYVTEIGFQQSITTYDTSLTENSR